MSTSIFIRHLWKFYFLAPVSDSHLKSYALSLVVLLCSPASPVDCVKVPSPPQPPPDARERGICWIRENQAWFNHSNASLYTEFNSYLGNVVKEYQHTTTR